MDGQRQALDNDFHRGAPLPQRVSKITAPDASQVAGKLNVDRTVEPQPLLKRSALPGGRLNRKHDANRIPDQPGNDKDNQAYPEEDDDAVSEPSKDEPSHLRVKIDSLTPSASAPSIGGTGTPA